MMARTSHAELEQQILASLDIEAEYRALGVTVVGRANADGWASCHAFGREDNDPSAEINVVNGRYKDFGGEAENLSFWDFAVKAGRFTDWRDARKHYAERAGVALPTKTKKHRGSGSNLEFLPWNEDLVALWCFFKPPITPEAVKANGGRLARYYDRYTVVALPIYPDGRLGDPCGWVLWHLGNQFLPVFNKDGEVVKWAKMKTTAGSEKGYLGEWGLARINGAERVWKVEGPPDMLAAWSMIPPELRETHVVVTNSGGCGEHPHGPGIPAIFTGKRAGIVHDCDIPGQNGSEGSLERNKLGWVGAIARVASESRNVVLPYPITEKHGRDLRDFFCEGHSYAELVGLYESAANAIAPPIASLEGPDDPHRLARLYLSNRHGSRNGVPILRYWLNEWHRWKDGSYRPVAESELASDLTTAVKEEFDRLNLIEQAEATDPKETRRVTCRLIRDVTLALQGMCTLEGDRMAPFWIGAEGPWPANEIFATENSLVHIPSLVDAESAEATVDANPLFFTLNGADYKFDSAAKKPEKWIKFLESVWPNDDEAIRALQQWFGYCLLPDTSQQKILFLVGPKRSGKGTIARILEKMVGRRNVCNPTLTSLGDRFGLWSLLGRTLGVIGDARISQRHDTAQVVENLLGLSGEDGKDIDRKQLPPLRGVRLNTRFVILSNEDPDLRDASGAIISRMIVLKLTNSFYRNEDKRLEAKLTKELPGIMLWAAEGYRDLQESGGFVEPESSRNAIKELERMVSPMLAFLEDCCIVNPLMTCPISAMYSRWKEWNKDDNGQDRVGTSSSFSRQLRAAVPMLDVIRPRLEGGTRERLFKGIAVKADSSVLA